LGRALVDGELMPQGHDLELHRESGSEEAAKERRESEKQGWHRYHLPGCMVPDHKAAQIDGIRWNGQES
jgi:hypothetical protein